jgi:hypothetical protein
MAAFAPRWTGRCLQRFQTNTQYVANRAQFDAARCLSRRDFYWRVITQCHGLFSFGRNRFVLIYWVLRHSALIRLFCSSGSTCGQIFNSRNRVGSFWKPNMRGVLFCHDVLHLARDGARLELTTHLVAYVSNRTIDERYCYCRPDVRQRRQATQR